MRLNGPDRLSQPDLLGITDTGTVERPGSQNSISAFLGSRQTELAAKLFAPQVAAGVERQAELLASLIDLEVICVGKENGERFGWAGAVLR